MSTNTLDNVQDKACAMANAALADLAAQLDAGHSDALKGYLAFLARFHRYSALNVLLIRTQRPDATHVAGFNRWKDMRRNVRKGEKGIAILAPCVHKRRDQDGMETETELVTGFRTAYVFDLAQTTGPELPTIGEVRGNPCYQLNALKSLVHEKGIKTEYRDDLGGARGVSTGGKILLLCGMSHAKQFAVLAHELAHELMHKGERRQVTDVRIRELEAEAVSYVVSTAIGLDNGTSSVDYIHLYNGDSKALALSLKHIQETVKEILDYLL